MDQPTEAKRLETPEQVEKRVALAQREHDRADRNSTSMFPAVAGFAVEALKAPALVNGGSAAAMLAFIGTGRQPVTSDTILGLKTFGIGLILAALVTAFTYLAQALYLWQSQTTVHDWHHPFVFETNASRRNGRLAVAFHVGSIVLVLAAYGCATFGLLSVAGSLVVLPAKP